MNITIDDSSPRIQYYSASTDSKRRWARAAEVYDGGIVKYFGKSFTVTTGEGDRTVFTFNGSAIWVFGSTWDNHGWYTAQLDDGTPVTHTEGFTTTRQFQTLMHSEGGLSTASEHTLTLTNLATGSPDRVVRGGNFYLDVDYIVVQQPVDTKVYTTHLDDFSPRINYTGAWYMNGSGGHISNRPGDSSTLAFNGSSIEVFGTLFPDHGNYSVSIDGVSKGVFNGLATRPLVNVSLFSASGLQDTQHTIVVTNLGGPQGNFFDIDRIVFNSTIDPSIIPFPTPAATSADTAPPQSIAATAGGVAGAVVALLLIAAAAWLIWKRKRKQGDAAKRDADPLDLTGEEIKPFQESMSPSEREEARSEYFLPSERAAAVVRRSTSDWDHQSNSLSSSTSSRGLPMPNPFSPVEYPPSQLSLSSAAMTGTTLVPSTTMPSSASPSSVGDTADRVAPPQQAPLDRKSAWVGPTAATSSTRRTDIPGPLGAGSGGVQAQQGGEGHYGVDAAGRETDAPAGMSPPPYHA